MGCSDWLKVRLALPRDPIVVAMAADCACSVPAIVGGWICVWCVAHEHTSDGVLRGMDGAGIDAIAGVPGFALAGERRGWLTVTTLGVVLVRWDKHNSPQARQRLQATERQRRRRGGKDAPRAAAVPSKAVDLVWAAWPANRRQRSVASKEAIRKAIRVVSDERRLSPEMAAQWLIRRVEAWASSRDVRAMLSRGEERFVPTAARWFDERRYDDEDEAGKLQGDPFALD